MFLLKTCVAPAPSRDFYAIRVVGNQLSLCIWRISHGRHNFPHEKKESLTEFVQDHYMQEEIRALFGMETVESIMEIAHGHKDYLPYLPMKILLKILCSLDLKDIGNFAQVCKKCREITLNNDLWKQLFQKYNKMEITYEDRRKVITYGWKKLFIQKKLHLKSEKKHKISSKKLSSSGKSEKKSTEFKSSTSQNALKIRQSNSSNTEATKIAPRSKKLQTNSNMHIKKSPGNMDFEIPDKPSLITNMRAPSDTMDDDTDDKDDTKRKSRNLSEKKRRDQFNMLINELSSMVSTNSRKMDKSTVLKSTISFLKNHNATTPTDRRWLKKEDWKPSFLSNEEFTHLILEALDGFIMVFSSSGRIFYASESITSLLGHLPSDLLNMTIYDLVYEDDQSELYNVLLNPASTVDAMHFSDSEESRVCFTCHLKRGGLDFEDEETYELVQFVGYFRSDVEPLEVDNFISSSSHFSSFSGEADSRLIFVGTGRLHTPLLIREMSVVDSTKSEFTSRHSLEWKFLFLDHRAPPIIGYLPFEVLGTSVMQKGEGTSCHYRFLTKGQQWIWLQTRFYITYHQWNSKPEFIVCTHRVELFSKLPSDVLLNESFSKLPSYGSSEIPDEPSLITKFFKNTTDGSLENYSFKRTQDGSLENNSFKRTPDGKKPDQPHHCYMDVMKEMRKAPEEAAESRSQENSQDNMVTGETQFSKQQASQSGLASSPWSSKSSAGKQSRIAGDVRSPQGGNGPKVRTRHSVPPGAGSDSTSMSADSPSSRHSQITQHSTHGFTKIFSIHPQKAKSRNCSFQEDISLIFSHSILWLAKEPPNKVMLRWKLVALSCGLSTMQHASAKIALRMQFAGANK
ncbi:hypothetical protein L9F63_009636, partial [Diploptera punctata]